MNGFRVQLMTWGTIGALGASVALGLAPGAPTVSPEQELESNDGTYRLRAATEPVTLVFGERFAIRVHAERADGGPFEASLAVDARMPEHGHGMNREPRIERLEDGDLRITNMLFHMPGYWEVYFDLTRGAITERAQFSVEVD